jgi:hypothetical protein
MPIPEKENKFWMAVRAALLAFVAAIEDYIGYVRKH